MCKHRIISRAIQKFLDENKDKAAICKHAGEDDLVCLEEIRQTGGNESLIHSTSLYDQESVPGQLRMFFPHT